MPYSAEGSELERLSGLFGQNFLLILFLILIVFLMENQSVFKQGLQASMAKLLPSVPCLMQFQLQFLHCRQWLMHLVQFKPCS